MDIISERKIAYNDNVIRKAAGLINGLIHVLQLRKEGKRFLVTLNDGEYRIAMKSFMTKKFANKYFDKLKDGHNFVKVDLNEKKEASTQIEGIKNNQK